MYCVVNAPPLLWYNNRKAAVYHTAPLWQTAAAGDGGCPSYRHLPARLCTMSAGRYGAMTAKDFRRIRRCGMTGMAYVRILRDLREDADKTQAQIAEVLGTSQTMYARYERGANELPIHHLITLSKYYGVSTDYLLGLSKER